MLYMKPKLFIAVNHDTVLNLGYDCGVCFLNTSEAGIVQKDGRPKKLAPIKACFVGMVYRMHIRFGNHWVE